MPELWQPVSHGGGQQTPTRIVVHSMAEYLFHDGEWMHASDFLNAIGLSAHALVCPDGVVIRQRRDDQVAWHAKGFNQNSLGCEILVQGRWDYDSWRERIRTPFVKSNQWLAGCEFVRNWVNNWGILQIDRHSDIDPSRKPDPGEGFPWEQFLERVLSDGTEDSSGIA